VAETTLDELARFFLKAKKVQTVTSKSS
jgi:hypothetical protein